MTPLVVSEEAFLSARNASRQGFGDAALHKNRARHSDRTWGKIVDRQAAKDRALASRRDRLRVVYAYLVRKGKIRPPTYTEQLQLTAAGSPDREDVQAARRVLARRGAYAGAKSTLQEKQ